MQFLNPGGVVGWNDEREVRELLQVAPALAQKRDDAHAARFRRLRRADHVGALAGRGVQHEEIAWLRQRLDLPGKDPGVPVVVPDGGERGGIRVERDRRQGLAVAGGIQAADGLV